MTPGWDQGVKKNGGWERPRGVNSHCLPRQVFKIKSPSLGNIPLRTSKVGWITLSKTSYNHIGSRVHWIGNPVLYIKVDETRYTTHYFLWKKRLNFWNHLIENPLFTLTNCHQIVNKRHFPMLIKNFNTLLVHDQFYDVKTAFVRSDQHWTDRVQ